MGTINKQAASSGNFKWLELPCEIPYQKLKGKKGLINVEVIIIVALIVNLTGVVVATHRSFKEKMGRMTCDANMKNIMEAMQIYYAYYNLERVVIRGQRISNVNLGYLASKGFLQHVLSCPNAGIYKWDSDEELYCTYHGKGELD